MRTRKPESTSPRFGLARVLSKRGLASRTQAAQWVQAGRIKVNGRIVRDPEFPICMAVDQIAIDDASATTAERIYVMLNKPRGLVTTTSDEQGRDTVYRCFDGAGLPWLAPVGRLDKASEGLLLFSNDPAWAAGITGGDRDHAITKTYHVQIDRRPDGALLAALTTGVFDSGERLSAVAASVLRIGEKNAWLEITLDEGRNRHIRRLLAAFDIGVLRLVRVAIGKLALGDLGKGQWRRLRPTEVEMLGQRE